MYAAHYSVGLSLGLYACMHQVCPALVAAEVTQPAATQSSNTEKKTSNDMRALVNQITPFGISMVRPLADELHRKQSTDDT